MAFFIGIYQCEVCGTFTPCNKLYHLLADFRLATPESSASSTTRCRRRDKVDKWLKAALMKHSKNMHVHDDYICTMYIL
jgi:polyferredoxin